MKVKIGTYVYVTFLSIASIVLLLFLYTMYGVNNYGDILFWGSLAIITETLLIPMPSRNVGVSVGLAISVATFIISGPFVGALVSGLAFVFRIPYINNKRIHIFNSPLYKSLFNISQSVLIIGSAGMILYSVMGYTADMNLSILVPFVTLLVMFCHISNDILISFILYIQNGANISKTAIDGLKGMFVNMIAISTLGILLAVVNYNYGRSIVVLFFIPLLVARHSFKLYFESQQNTIEIIHALNDAIDVKDAYTGDHASRVGDYAVGLAIAYGMGKKDTERIRKAALLHDIGKIGIPDAILNKTGKLSEDEFKKIMEHPVMGAKILSNVVSLKDISKIIRHHHEKYNGTGYPDALKSRDTPLESAILSIADSFDAMTTDRPYRKAMTKQEAMDELVQCKGSQFNPKLVDLFIEVI